MIILLNGASSSGKTSLATAIQHLSDDFWLHLGIDTFIEMMPRKYLPSGHKAKEGFSFNVEKNDNGQSIRIDLGTWGEKIFDTIPLVTRTLADCNINIIVDEVILSEENLKTYLHNLHSHTVYLVGVFCDLNVMQEREILRCNRTIGLANGQSAKIHPKHREYDLVVNTTNQSPFTLAGTILDFIDANPNPQAFIKNHKCF